MKFFARRARPRAAWPGSHISPGCSIHAEVGSAEADAYACHPDQRPRRYEHPSVTQRAPLGRLEASSQFCVCRARSLRARIRALQRASSSPSRTPWPLFKQVCVSAGADEDDLVVGGSVDQEPIRLDVAFAVIVPLTLEGVIATCRRQGIAGTKRVSMTTSSSA